MTSSPEPPADSPGDGPAARLLRVAQTPWAAALLGVLCFLNTIGNDFVYDDIYIIRDNPRIRSLTSFSEIWLADWWHPQNTQILPEFHRRDRLYRPLTLFSFAVDYDLFGVVPGAYHAVNIAWHAAGCALLWLFAWRLLGDRAIATVAALWFAVHPIHCEAVANIVGRAEVMAGVFLLAGLIVLLPSGARPRWPRGLCAAACFFLALLSKETAVCYAPVAALAIWLKERRAATGRAPLRWWVQHGVILLLPLGAYLPLRYHALHGQLLRDRPPSPLLNPLVDSPLPERLADAGTVLGHYTRLLVAPSVLSSNYGAKVIDPDRRPDAMTWLGFAGAAAWMVALVGLGRRDGPGLWLAALAAMLLASYALISNTVLVIGVSVAERLMYWPSAPALLLLATLLVVTWRRFCQPAQPLAGVAGLLRIGGALLLVALSLRTIVRNTDWSSNEVLFATDVATYPQSVHLNNGAARECLILAANARDPQAKREYLDRALALIDQALRLMPSDFDSLYVRGRTLMDLDRRPEAIAVLEQALLFNPFDKPTQALLAEVRDKKTADRIAALEDALATQPADTSTALEVSRLLLAAARPIDALKHLERLTETRPDDPQVLELLAEALAVSEQYERATEVAQRTIAVQPENWRIHIMLTWLLSEKHPAESLVHAREARRLQPGDFRTNWNLAEAFAANKMYPAAIDLFETIRAGLPDGDPYQQQVDVRLEVLRALARRER